MSKKYIITAFFFIVGIIFVSVVKNETRNLQREIDNLNSSIQKIKINLYEANLDHVFITSPENIMVLANDYLEPNFIFYHRSQLKNLSSTTSVEFKKIKLKKNYAKLKKKNLNSTNLVLLKKHDGKKLLHKSKPEKDYNKIQQWLGFQVLKVALGIPPLGR